MKNGIVIVNKEEGLSSQAVVNRVKRIFGVKKAGHTGTLDPLATGVLPVLIGRAVKASDYLLTKDKHYVATLLLGITTDSEDVTGEVLTESTILPSEDEVRAAVVSMLGKSMQTPPMYSAIKINGKKLCDLAREGKTVEREAREITVFDISTEKINEREYLLDVHCSKGTYIRTLCADIGKRLGCGGAMKALCRSEVSMFSLKDSHTLAELEAMSEGERDCYVLPTEIIFKDYKKIMLVPFFARLARCGQPIYCKKAKISAELGERVTFYDEKGFFAIGECVMHEDELCIRATKQFDV